MARYFLLAAIAIVFCNLAGAQAYEGSISYNKKNQQAFVIEYAYSPDAVQNAFVKKMESMGYKSREEKGLFNRDKGFLVFSGAIVPDIISAGMDYFVKVERKSRKDDNSAVLYMVINDKAGANVFSTFDADGISHAKNFLNNLAPDVEAANLELQIIAQQDVVTKAQKKLKRLQDDKTDMEKKIKKLQEDSDNNVKEQGKAQKDIENQQKALDDLRAKRKSSI
jgi:hypothetical protein